MPGKALPLFTPTDIAAHRTAKSCYVTLGRKVFDVTSFIDDHPGGGELILEYAGKDVAEIMGDVISHQHSEAAYEILEDCFIGLVAPDTTLNGSNAKTTGCDITNSNVGSQPVYEATGMSKAEDLTVETDYTKDYQTHKFLDLNRPLLPQLWCSGFSKEFYLEQVHRPRHYKGGESAPLFGNFLEPFSKTAWYIIPIVWLPLVAYVSYVGSRGLCIPSAVGYFAFGICFWSLIEYFMHRFLFHIDKCVAQLLSVYVFS